MRSLAFWTPSRRLRKSNVPPTASVAEVRITVSTCSKQPLAQQGGDVDGRGLHEHAAPAPLPPIDHVAFVAFQHHFKASRAVPGRASSGC